MEVSGFVISAGRAVLDMVEREWQPLSADELDQRLDHAVEEILETELITQLKSQSTSPPTPPAAPVYVHLLQSQHNVEPQVLQTAAAVCGSPVHEEETADSGNSAAVKCITELLQSSKSQRRLAGRARLSLSQTVLLSLTLLSERISYRTVSRRLLLEKGNIHRNFFSFCECISTQAERKITWPVGDDAAHALFPLVHLEKRTEAAEQTVPQVLGVLGHTHIPMRSSLGKRDLETSVPEVKRIKKEADPDSWLNLELLCDHRGRFLHCTVSKGSDVDRGSALRHKLQQHPELMPPGSCILAKTGYPLTADIITPYRKSLGPREELFNKILEEHFLILGQAVSSLKARFQRLKYLDIGNYDRARAVVLTACVLHNVFLDMGQVVQVEVEKEDDLNHKGDYEEEEGINKRDAISDRLIKSFELSSM